MTEQATSGQFQKEILEFLEETFERVHGIYLDQGTSFFETLEHVTAEEASSRASDRRASVAAHVRHVAFYLRVLQASIRGESVGKVNWLEIWESDRPVTPEAWRATIGELREEYARVTRLMKDPATWEKEDAVGGSMAMVTHTAYHLGAIRQALGVIRARPG
jgi:hypothetical protein